jgi:hypothetical protein
MQTILQRSLKMMNPSKEDHRKRIHFPEAEGCQPAEIHRQTSAIYDAACVPRSKINIQVNPLIASSCCMIMPIPMWPTEFRTN